MTSTVLPRLAAAVLAAGLAAGCQSGGTTDGTLPRATSSSPAAPTTQQLPDASTISLPGVPDDLRTAVWDLYTGKTVPATKEAAAVLTRRTAPDVGPSEGKASAAEWKGTPVASVAVGEDLTLYTKESGKWQVVGGWWPSMKAPTPVLGTQKLVLLMGSDARPGQDMSAYRSDAIQLVAWDGKTGGAILGTARDTWVPVLNTGYAKINEGLKRGGPEGMVRTLEAHSGLTIEGWYLTDFVGFVKSVDAIGGLEVTLPQAMQAGTAALPKGKQTLDGQKTLKVARERKSLPNGDFDRSRNQGMLLVAGAAVVKASGPGATATFIDAMAKHTRSNQDAEQTLHWFARLHRMDLNQIDRNVCTGGLGWQDQQSVVYAGAREKALYRDITDGRLG